MFNILLAMINLEHHGWTAIKQEISKSKLSIIEMTK